MSNAVIPCSKCGKTITCKCNEAPAHPGPWRTNSGQLWIVMDADGMPVVECKDAATAARIVAAVNQDADTTETARAAHRKTLALLAACVALMDSLLTEGGRMAVACCHLDGDRTYDEVRCWNEVSAEARALLARVKGR